MKNRVRIFTLLLLGFACFSSCQRDANTNWATDIVAPLASTNLTIKNLIKDSILSTNSDSSLSISYQNTIYELNLADQYIHIPDTSIGKKYTVDSLVLPDIHLSYVTSLGQMAQNLISTGSQSLLGYYLIGHNGQQSTIPPISNLPVAPFNFDASSIFSRATLSEDSILLYIDNELPIPLQNVSYELRNTVANTVILSDNISYLPPFTGTYRWYSLPGITIESSLNLKVTNFSSPGSNGNLVTIDTSNYLLVKGYIYHIRVDSAVAKFASQDIISQNQELTEQIGERKFTYVDAQSGRLRVAISSAVKQPLNLLYKLIGAYDKNGHPLTATSYVPAAVGNQLSTVTQIYDLSGFAINLTGTNGSKFNTYTQVINAHIDSNGVQTSISSTDSIHIQYFLENIKPRYIKGYAGRDTVHYAGTSPFSISSIFGANVANALRFNKAKLSVSIDNGLGIDGQVTINNLTCINAAGNAVSLVDHAASPIIGYPLYINRATDFPLTSAISTFTLSSTTSNFADFISNLPTKVNYDVSIKTNPGGNRGRYDDFAYIDSKMKVNLNVNVPLSLIANNLTLMDSFNFTLAYSQKDVANIKDGTLHLLIDNKFPLQATVTLLAYDAGWHLIDTLLSGAQVSPGHLNSSCRADQSVRSVLNIPASASLIDRIRAVTHAVLRVSFNTSSSSTTCNGQYLSIYSDYNIAAKITADLNYKVKF
jgi:hypothetical protein